jgi:hypothetical protein
VSPVLKEPAEQQEFDSVLARPVLGLVQAEASQAGPASREPGCLKVQLPARETRERPEAGLIP